MDKRPEERLVYEVRNQKFHVMGLLINNATFQDEKVGHEFIFVRA